MQLAGILSGKCVFFRIVFEFFKGAVLEGNTLFSFLLDEIVRPFVNYNKRELNFLCHLIISLGDQIVTSKIRK